MFETTDILSVKLKSSIVSQLFITFYLLKKNLSDTWYILGINRCICACMYIHTEEQSPNTAIDFTRKGLPPILDPPISFFRSIICSVTKSCPTLCNPTDCSLSRLLCPWDFFRQEYWSGLPFPSPGELPNPGE